MIGKGKIVTPQCSNLKRPRPRTNGIWASMVHPRQIQIQSAPPHLQARLEVPRCNQWRSVEMAELWLPSPFSALALTGFITQGISRCLFLELKLLRGYDTGDSIITKTPDSRCNKIRDATRHYFWTDLVENFSPLTQNRSFINTILSGKWTTNPLIQSMLIDFIIRLLLLL